MLRELSGLGVYPPACKTQHECLDKEIPNCKNTQDRPDFTLVFAWLCVLPLFFFSCSSVSCLCWVLVRMSLCITLFFYEPCVFCVHFYKLLNGYRRTKGENVVHSGLMTSSLLHVSLSGCTCMAFARLGGEFCQAQHLLLIVDK